MPPALDNPVPSRLNEGIIMSHQSFKSRAAIVASAAAILHARSDEKLVRSDEKLVRSAHLDAPVRSR
jgi:hypothetical protein